MNEGLSYDDVLLVPKRSPVDSRSEVDLSVNLAGIDLERPILSAPMDTVTEKKMAIRLSELGGLGTIHRFMDVSHQCSQVMDVKRADEYVVGAVGINENYISRATALRSSGADAIMVDVAHGHLEKALQAVQRLNGEISDIPIIAGNVATPEGVEDLVTAGADVVKIGIGPGSHCTTREVAGVGIPQFSAVSECSSKASELGADTIADGGIRSSGDAVKALMAGATAVMMGSMFMGTDESPGEVLEVDGEKIKQTHGLASQTFQSQITEEEEELESASFEGVAKTTEYKGEIQPIVENFCAGIRSGLSYCGGINIPAARSDAEFVKVSGSSQRMNGAHEGY